jgi:hypothetical protein
MAWRVRRSVTSLAEALYAAQKAATHVRGQLDLLASLADRHPGGSATEGAEARPRRRAAAQADRLLEQWGRTMDRRRRLELIPEEVYGDE